MNFLIILSILFFSFLTPIDYEIFKNENYGIKLNKPQKWVYWNKEEIRENIGKLKFTEEELKEILQNNNQSKNIATFAKYPKTARKQLIPIVYVFARPNSTNNTEDFFKVIVKSVEDLRRYFKEFKYLENAKIITLKNGIEAVYISTESVLERPGGQIIHSKSKIVAIPRDGYFFQMNFTDGFEEEDCQKIFEEIIDSIEVE